MHGEAPKLKKVMIAFLSHDRVHAGFTYDYGHLIGHFIGSGGYIPETGQSWSMSLDWCMTSILPDGRQKIVEDCLGKGADKILWIDSDMRFPRQGLHMLLRHDVPIVGANYVSRRPPFRFTAGKTDGEFLETKPDDTGLVEVGHLGFGFLLTDVSVFEGDGPWFSFDWHRNEEGRWTPIGEDVFFCREARARGHKVYVDQELSASMGHTGEWIFTAEELARVPEAVT